ncbi:MAG: hypothetical protein C3F18_09740 [Nitrosomonadales bacterium]|nr:MAG: hypothetical protein C3F18_09740 [Nitrosomonadales bacterium]
MEKLTLLLSPGQMDTQCQVLITQTRHSGQTLAALTALHSFITATARPDEQTGSAYHEIKRILEQHIASARNSVMDDNLARLLGALEEQSLSEIQGVHAALSRNGFHQTVLAAIQRLPDARLRAAAAWADAWQRDARTRAEAASPYPDALNLRGAGVSPARFAAMSELNIYLQEAVA